MKNNTTKNQTNRLLKLLTQSPKHSFELRNAFGIGSPTSRISDLRKAGHAIETERINLTSNGYFHKGVARYSLTR